MSIAERDRPPLTPGSADGTAPTSLSLGIVDNGTGLAEEGEDDLCPFPADPTFDDLGYKVLLYITRCFRGRVLGSAAPLSESETAKVIIWAEKAGAWMGRKDGWGGVGEEEVEIGSCKESQVVVDRWRIKVGKHVKLCCSSPTRGCACFNDELPSIPFFILDMPSHFNLMCS